MLGLPDVQQQGRKPRAHPPHVRNHLHGGVRPGPPPDRDGRASAGMSTRIRGRRWARTAAAARPARSADR